MSRRGCSSPCAQALSPLLWSPAHAVDAILVKPEQEKIDITALGELYEGRGDRLQIETAPGRDGYVGRMAVQATTAGTNPGWLVFALTNPTTERITRWLVAPRYTLANSRVASPELDAGRIAAITPSLGFRPERMKSDRADMFRLSLEPGQTVTFAAEMSSRQVPRLMLWDPEVYQAKQQDRMLFNGVLLGITGLLAIFLTAIFAANHRAIFPATALVAWAVLAYFCVDFGYWSKLFPVDAEHVAVYRAAAEAGVAASLVLFLYAFLRIGLWHGWIKTLFWCWIAAQFGLVVLAIIDPRLASGLARGSMVGIAAIGTCLIAYLALRGQDRALSAHPELDAAARLAVRRRHDRARQAVRRRRRHRSCRRPCPHPRAARLHRHPIRLPLDRRPAPAWAGEPGADQIARRRWLRRRTSGSGTPAKDHITVDPEIEEALGTPPGTLDTTVDHFLQHMHSRRPRALPPDAVVAPGKCTAAICKPNSASSARTAPISGTSFARAPHRATMRGVLRCVGLMRDVTSLKRSHERLMHDAVHDSLTSLPNRELFMDRLQGAITRAREGKANRPTVMFIDIDRFKNVNKSFGLAVGDSMLLTLGRRLVAPSQSARHAGAARRRPVRHSHDLGPRPAPGRDACRARAPRAAHADEDRRQGDRAHRLDRHRRR